MSTCLARSWELPCLATFRSLSRASLGKRAPARRQQNSRASASWVSAYLRRFRSSQRHRTGNPHVASRLPPERRHLGGSRDWRWAGAQGSRVRKARGFTPSAPAKSKAAPSVLAVIGRSVWRRSLASGRAGRPWARPPPGPHSRLLLFVSLAPSFSRPEGNVGRSSRTDVAARVSPQGTSVSCGRAARPLHFFRVLSPLAQPGC